MDWFNEVCAAAGALRPSAGAPAFAGTPAHLLRCRVQSFLLSERLPPLLEPLDDLLSPLPSPERLPPLFDPPDEPVETLLSLLLDELERPPLLSSSRLLSPRSSDPPFFSGNMVELCCLHRSTATIAIVIARRVLAAHRSCTIALSCGGSKSGATACGAICHLRSPITTISPTTP